MNNKLLIQILGFSPKENASGIYIKQYADGYAIEVDYEKGQINYGESIKADSKTTQNFTQDENFVVLECVDRLLMTGYKPTSIILEPTWKLGRQEKGRLDILVKKEEKSYLMIECKTFGKEFDDELKKMKRDGGQLFSYFQQDKNAEILMLYTSKLDKDNIIFKNEIVKIKEEYRLAASVKDFYSKWDKNTKQQGVWENPPYDFKSKIFTKADLVVLNETESKKIFNEFASILRKHSVSDKPNAFNKIFNLFLAKIYDEAKGDGDELGFRWREDDNAVDFQVRLINLHKDGLFAFLEKEIEGIDEKDFNASSPEELLEKKKKVLKFNNILAIKEVLDDASFDENQRVLKDVVKLLEKYQIRYPRKQQHLSNFFEKLLTTGLKQEVGQFFTPPPITKFIVRSLPIKDMILKEANSPVAKLPAIIDYAAGSGHFITEAMEEYQDIINAIDIDKDIKFPNAKNEISAWKANPYNWAATYVYGIEKDYRLVKVAKVGCYFYGDGVAQIIHGDGLDSFKTSKTYKGLLKENTHLDDSSKAKFSFVLSNPPYSVNDCKDDLEYIGAQKDFSLYSYLSDKSKEIECLFVERTKHLLKDGGIAAIILPSSILNNTGIQTKTREIILQYFDIIAIAELGGNTFMATNTNTVTLFLRRKSNQESIKLKEYVNKFSTEFIDNTINGIEKPVSKYVSYVWETVSFEDYLSLLKKDPSNAIKEHEIYKEYNKKIKAKKETEFWDKMLEIELDKLFYFIIAYSQRNIVLVKSGEKDAEKRFLGYYFSDRRGGEGMHSMHGGKTIDECTQLYNVNDNTDTSKASSYIYNAFLGNTKLEVDENLKENISYADLLDMMTFDRVDFEKNVSLAAKKKMKIESKWEIKRLGEFSQIDYGTRIVRKTEGGTIYPVYGGGGETFKANSFNRKDTYIISRFGMSPQCVRFIQGEFFLNDSGMTLDSLNTEILIQKYLNYYLYMNQEFVYFCGRGVAQKNIDIDAFNSIPIPLPPKEIQAQIVAEIEALEEKEKVAVGEMEGLKREIAAAIHSEKKIALKSLLETINPDKKYFTNLDEGIDVSFLSMPDVSNEGQVINLQKKKLKEVKTGFTFFQEDDVLFAKITPCMENGKGALVPKLENNIGFGSTEFFVLRADKQKLLPKILFYFTQSEEFRNSAEKVMTGASGHRRVPKPFIETYEVPFFTIQEQQQIVSEIEKLESRILALETELKAIPQQKEAILRKYL